MELEYDSGRGAGLGMIGLLVLVALLLGGVLVLDKCTAQQDAAAQRLYAEAAVVRAETARDAQRQEGWEHTFAMWTVAMASFNSANQATLTIVAVVAAVVLGLAGYRFLEKRGVLK